MLISKTHVKNNEFLKINKAAKTQKIAFILKKEPSNLFFKIKSHLLSHLSRISIGPGNNKRQEKRQLEDTKITKSRSPSLIEKEKVKIRGK